MSADLIDLSAVPACGRRQPGALEALRCSEPCGHPGDHARTVVDAFGAHPVSWPRDTSESNPHYLIGCLQAALDPPVPSSDAAIVVAVRRALASWAAAAADADRDPSLRGIVDEQLAALDAAAAAETSESRS